MDASSICFSENADHFFVEISNVQNKNKVKNALVPICNHDNVEIQPDPVLEELVTENPMIETTIPEVCVDQTDQNEFDDLESSYDSFQSDTFDDCDGDDDSYVPPSSVDCENLPLRKSERQPNVRCDFASFIVNQNVMDSTSVEDAMSSSNASKWIEAMKREYDTLIENQTWSLEKLPPGRKPIACKWVFKTKCNADGVVNQHKARLVVKECAQKRGIDYDETFSPIVRYSSIRYLIARAFQRELGARGKF